MQVAQKMSLGRGLRITAMDVTTEHSDDKYPLWFLYDRPT
jgi:hypothetical protein